MNREEFAQSIKQKYPQYNSLNDDDLANRMLAKFPEYQSQITETKQKQGFVEKAARFLTPKSVEGFAETLGGAATTISGDYKEAEKSQASLDSYNQKLGTAIIANKKAGKDTARLEQLYEKNTGQRLNLKDIIGETADKSIKQIAGEALGTVGAIALGAKGFSTVGKRLAFGSALGSTFGTSEALIRDETAANVVTSGLVGGVIGLALGGVLEGGSALVRKTVPRIGKHTFTKELQPPTKDLVRQVENGWATFGEKVRSISDDAGEAVYKGTYKTMRKQAIGQLDKQGKQLMDLAKDYDGVIKVKRSQAVGDMINQLQNTFGKLTKNQLKSVQFEVSRMPQEMNATQIIENKRLYDGLIPDSFWLKAGDANVAFNTQAKYILRDNLRKVFNERVDDIAAQKLNNELSIAMDVRHLASEQIALRLKRKISGEGGFFYKLIGRFIDDYIFNPALTTRISQATSRAGQTTGQTPLRSAARNVLIKNLTK